MVGKTLSHYKIISKLGEGGMGVVYKARDTKLDREVALKFLPTGSISSSEEKARFEQEAKAAAKLSHANIATVHAIDEVDGQSFIAMEYVDGETLSEKIERGPLKLSEAIIIAVQIGEGLQAAHEKKITHRDIKSQNIMLTDKGVVKIMDFGLAKLSGRTKVTKEGMTLGTAGYMSPEQARGEKIDHRSDIWSLGVVLYEMISGQLPFKGDYEQAVIYAILNEGCEPLTALRSGVPMELERIVGKCLAKKADARYQHVEEAIVDLKQLESSSLLEQQAASGQLSSVQPAQLADSGAKPGRRVLVYGLVFIGVMSLLLIALSATLNKADPEPVFLNLVLDDHTEFGSPSWNHTGDRIYYVRIVDEWDSVVESFELSTGARQIYPATRGASLVAASPTDDSFIFVKGSDAFLMRDETAQPFFVTDGIRFESLDWTTRDELLYLSGRRIMKVDLSNSRVDTLLTKSAFFTGPGCCQSYHVVGNANQNILHYGMFRNVGPVALIELDRESGEERIVGEGFPLAMSPSGHLIVLDMTLIMSVYAVDGQGRVTGERRPLQHAIGLDISPAGHVIFRPMPDGRVTGGGEPIHMITADGSRLPLGSIPGMPSISEFTVSPNGDFMVMAGQYLDEGPRLGIFDVKNRSSNVIDVGFPPTAASFSADGWIYFTDREEPSSIYKARLINDGIGDVVPVLSDSLSSRGPSASPSGLVAFHREVEDGFRIFVFDEKTGSQKQVTNQTGNQYFASIHPTAPLIAYVQRFQERSIVIENLQTSDRKTIATGSVFDPRFSHDGKFFYFISEGIVVRMPVSREGNRYVLGEPEKVAFEPFSHIHYAPGRGDISAYTASPPSPRDSAEPYKVILNYHFHLDQILGK